MFEILIGILVAAFAIGGIWAILTNPGDYEFQVGDRVRIKYLPDRQENPVMIENYQE